MSDKDDEDERRKLAREIVKQLLLYIDTQLGSCMRKKLTYVVLAMIVAGAISLGIIKFPGIGH